MASPPTSRSLLQLARDSRDVACWKRLHDLYSPLVRRWVSPYVDQAADADDVVQDVLTAVVREIKRFEHNGRVGAFRAWLRAITVNRLRVHWQSRRGDRGTGDPAVLGLLHQLEDPYSLLSRSWDDEHDRHVASVLVQSIRLEFQPATWHAFDALVRQGLPAADVARDLGVTLNTVLIAKSRVLKRLRQKARGLID